MADNNTNETYKRRGKGGLKSFVLILLMIAAVVLGIGTFFRITDIEVTGATVYTPEEIIKVSGIETGQSILLVKSSDARRSIKKQFAYIDSVSVKRSFPGSVTITVQESFPVAALYCDGSTWLVDKNVRLLEKCESGTAELMKITGMEIIQPVAGEPAAVSVDDNAKLAYLKDILASMQTLDIAKNVIELDMSNAGNISFTYTERFNVQMGRGDNSWDKLQLLKGVVDRLDEYEKGKIDLSVDGRAHFLPE